MLTRSPDPGVAARYGEVRAEREAVIAEFLLAELGDGPDAEPEARARAGAIIAATRAALRVVADHGGDLAGTLDPAIGRMERGFRDQA